MKRNAFILIFALLMLLSACTPPAATPSDPAAPQSGAGKPAETSETERETPPVQTPAKDEVVNAYEKATEVMTWFELGAGSMEDINYEVTKEVDEKSYCPVEHEDFSTLAEFDDYLRAMFSEGLVTELLDRGQFRDIDGKLYVLSADRGSDIFISDERSYELIPESGTKFILRVTYGVYAEDDEGGPTESIGQEESTDAVYEYVDGKWVFTQYTYIG